MSTMMPMTVGISALLSKNVELASLYLIGIDVDDDGVFIRALSRVRRLTTLDFIDS